MEKIKHALDKARKERASAAAVSEKKIDAKKTDPLSYTRTRTIECRQSLLKDNRIVSALPQGKFTDAYKILSTQVLQRMTENKWSSLAVTGASSGVGKTTIAVNLSISISREIEYTVLLVDANLRDPGVDKLFGFVPEYGLSDYLTSEIDLSDILVHPEGIDHFVILPAGKRSLNSSELLASPKMFSLVDELTARYPKRIIIFDLPEVLGTSDAIAFMPCVDATLVVVEDDETRTGELKKSIEMLSITNIIGTVLNKSVYGV